MGSVTNGTDGGKKVEIHALVSKSGGRRVEALACWEAQSGSQLGSRQGGKNQRINTGEYKDTSGTTTALGKLTTPRQRFVRKNFNKKAMLDTPLNSGKWKVYLPNCSKGGTKSDEED